MEPFKSDEFELADENLQALLQQAAAFYANTCMNIYKQIRQEVDGDDNLLIYHTFLLMATYEAQLELEARMLNP